MTARRITKTTGLTAVAIAMAALAVAAFGAAAAQAKPQWLCKGKVLATSSEKCLIESENASNEEDGFIPKQLLVPALKIAIVCERETDSGELIGGEPGTDKVTATFTGCLVYSTKGKEENKVSRPKFVFSEKLSACSAHGVLEGKAAAEGEIVIKTNSKLAYKVGTVGTTREIITDVFEPTTSGGAFVTIDITGSSCAAKGEYETKGSAIAYVETQVATGSKPYSEVLVGGLNFEYTPTLNSEKTELTGCAQNPTEYETAAKEKIVDTLTFGTHPACFYDVDWVTLAAGGKWGVTTE